MAKTKHGRYLQVDPDALSAVIDQRGLSVEELAGIADVSVGTINNMLKGERSFRSRVLAVAEALHTSVPVLMRESSSAQAASIVHEYLVSDVLTDWVAASNGLRFQVCRLRHLELDRYARGKRFDLRELSTDDEQRCRTWIKRHPNVCETLRNHPNIIRNVTAFHDPIESFYWVIDEWIDGASLQRKLRNAPLDESSVRQLLLDIANGLQALHEQGIVRRELNPASILIRHTDGQAILTEFELAKLIDRGPTVSTGDWPVDPYRAGEADADDVDLRADIYSWARIGIHALLGELPDRGNEEKMVKDLSIPESAKLTLLESASAFRSSRPPSFRAVVPTIELWR